MSKWSKLKVALLTAATTLSALQLGGCGLGGLNGLWDWDRIIRLVAIGNIFD